MFSEDFSGNVSLDSILEKMISTGFQATNIGLAIEQVNKMVCH
jgi:deoxyhypusine synthase